MSGAGARVLHLSVVAGYDLKAMDSNGMSDPYVLVKVGEQQKKTKVVAKSLHPVWEEEMTVSATGDALVLQVFDRDMVSRDDFMGQAVFCLKEFPDGFSGWAPLMDITGMTRAQGKIHIKFALDTEVHKGNMGLRRATTLQAVESAPMETIETELNLFVGTWNVGNEPPAQDLGPWIPTSGHDVYVIGVQECVYTLEKGGNVEKDWQRRLEAHFGAAANLIQIASRGEMRIAMFANVDALHRIEKVETASEATGIGNVLANKGAVAIACSIDNTRFCFINSHLAAHQNQVAARNDDYRQIVTGLTKGFGRCVMTGFHHTFWCGDLNYRLWFGMKGSVNEAKEPSKQLFSLMGSKIERGDLAELFETDQLRREMKHRDALVGFQEGSCKTFWPTFKVKRQRGTVYKESRSPAWCDRILFRSSPGSSCTVQEYGSAPQVGTSDHKPVFASFKANVVSTPIVSPMLGRAVAHFTQVTGSNLVAADLNGYSDPYVLFCTGELITKSVSSKVQRKTLHPVWGDDDFPPVPFRWNHPDLLANALLCFDVMDSDRDSADDCIGHGSISLAAHIDGPAKFRCDLFLHGRDAGTLEGTLEVRWD